MSSSIERIKASSIDGRARNVRYIQNQLKRLHEELVKNATPIRDAILQDTAHSAAEIDVEYCLAVGCVKDEYLALDFEKSLQEEYLLANGKDSPDHREAVGTAYIAPTSHTLLFSVIAPLASAIAAGNCVILQLGQTLSAVNDVLRKVLVAALDFDTFGIVDSRPSDAKFFESCIQVVQFDTQDNQPLTKALISPESSRVVAVVDRTANVDEAAKALVKARFSFGGRSPYAPDLVLVNEFRTRDFSEAVLRQSTKYFADQSNGNGTANGNVHASAPKKKRSEKDSLVEKVKDDDGCDILVSGSRASIVQARSRASSLLKQKIHEPLLVFHSMSSLDDAIDFANGGDLPLLALYTFAAPTSAKYLTQFIDASISVTNHLPLNLLVGPAAPSAHLATPTRRYDKTMFSVPRPSYVQVAAGTSLLDEIVSDSPGKGPSKARKEMIDKAMAALPPTGQKPGGQVGFFEQGIITGVIVYILPVVGTVVGLSAWGLWAGVRKLRAR